MPGLRVTTPAAIDNPISVIPWVTSAANCAKSLAGLAPFSLACFCASVESNSPDRASSSFDESGTRLETIFLLPKFAISTPYFNESPTYRGTAVKSLSVRFAPLLRPKSAYELNSGVEGLSEKSLALSLPSDSIMPPAAPSALSSTVPAVFHIDDKTPSFFLDGALV